MHSDQFLEIFKRIAEKGLPGDEAHLTLMPVKRLTARKAKAKNQLYRKSAVAAILYPSEESIHCILIQRPSYDGVHGGQVSFPGGKMDDTDRNLEHTARRECFEEVNLPIDSGVFVTTLSEVYIPVSNFMVQPYIFFVDDLPPLSPDFREVESILSFDLFSLLNESILKTTSIEMGKGFKQKDVPYFDIENKIVWGATAMMLAEIKAILQKF